MPSSIENKETMESNKDSQPNDTCAICCGELNDARSITKCGHTYCTECLLNSVAKNSGSEEGTTRNRCPLCREQICDEVAPSAPVMIHLRDMKEQLEEANNKIIDMDKAYYHTLQCYRKDKLQVIAVNTKLATECDMYMERFRIQSSNIAELGVKCSINEKHLVQRADKILELEEKLKIAEYTTYIRGGEISKLRKLIPNESVSLRKPQFTFGQPKFFFKNTTNQPGIFVFGENKFTTQTKFTFG
jgi:hypothetical protein